jgi:hypothetical protein
MKNRYAAALGRIGAQARMRKFSPEQRQAIAGKAWATRLDGALPTYFRSLFVDQTFEDLRLPRDKSLLLLAVISRGTDAHLAWIRRRYGAGEIRRWIRRRRGRGLTLAQLMPWVPESTARTWTEST